MTAIVVTVLLAFAVSLYASLALPYYNGGGNSLNNFANLHVMMAIGNCEYFEVLLPEKAQKYAIKNDIEVDSEGFVHAVDGPGLGAHIDFDLIRDNTTEVLR
jgi:L-alanine-DL-glutamate epimerase-like enolase superfamily enzyme